MLDKHAMRILGQICTAQVCSTEREREKQRQKEKIGENLLSLLLCIAVR